MYLNPWRRGRPIADSQDDELLQQTNKRLTLNLLIQGAAAHTFITAHHLVADELEAIRPGLVRLYDSAVIAFHLNYWIGDIALVYGWWRSFWWRTRFRSHPFHRHPLLARYGGELARESKKHLMRRAWQKGVVPLPGFSYVQAIYLLHRTLWVEYPLHWHLVQVAKRATAEIWGIDENRLVAELTTNVAFGHLRTPRTWLGRMTRKVAVGYGGVRRAEDHFQVVGKAICFPLLLHELTKGTAELVGLHGLNQLDERIYEQVVGEADQLEYEVWLLQAGPEAWRRLLAAIPPGQTTARVLMHLARLDPLPLEKLMLSVVSDPPAAKRMLSVMLED